MGCWGMGMAQTDEFCEYYDEFMEEYDNGKAVAEITAGILAKYHAEFDDDDGVMHDVYFALAKAEWMCCEQSELVLNRVKEIIESGANIEFYRELEATESDLKIRQRNLEKFLQMLLVPREKPRKRKRTAPPAEKTFPPLEIGDCFAYKYGDGYRVMIILERFKPQNEREQVTVTIMNNVYSSDALKNTDFEQEEMGTMFTVTADDFLGQSVIKKVASVSISAKERERLLGVSAFMYGGKQSFRAEICESLSVTLKEFLYHCEENTAYDIQKLEIGGCYAYRYKKGYRFAVVMDSTELEGKKYWLIAILSDFKNTPSVDFLNTHISSFTMYDKDALPNLCGWEKVSSIDVPKDMQRRLYGKSRYIISGIFDFLQDRSSLQRKRSAFETLAPLLAVCKENSKSDFDCLEVGGCYAYRFKDGYKFAIILDRPVVDGEECVLVAVLHSTYLSAGDSIPQIGSDSADFYMNEGISQTGIFSRDLLPSIEDWTLRAKLDLPEHMTEKAHLKVAITTESILRFFAEPPYYSGALTLNKFLSMYVEKQILK